MKKILNKVNCGLSSLANSVKHGLEHIVCRVRNTMAVLFLTSHNLLRSQHGEGFVDTAIKILMAVVIGALILAGLYALFGETILPTLKQRIMDMFNYGN